MDAGLKFVIHLPLTELWNNHGPMSRTRGPSLTSEQVTSLLRTGRVQFVIADVGLSLRWIPVKDCYEFWKEEVKLHLAKEERFILDEYPGCYCYVASEWSSATELGSIVLLEKYH